MDLILRNARFADGSVHDIGIVDDRIVEISHTPIAHSGRDKILDIGHRLTLPAFVNGQLHACKSFYRRNLVHMPEHVKRLPRFEAARSVKEAYTEEDVFARVDETMRLAILNGICAIRLFADVDEHSGLVALCTLLRIRERYKHIMTVQVVAFPQDGVLGSQTQSLMRTALDLGADVVGGIPWIEPTNALQREHTQLCFDLAQQYGRPVHMVCDDAVKTNLRTLEMIVEQTMAKSMQGRVCATQCAALAAYDDAYAADLIARVYEAQISIVCNSHVGLIATDLPMDGARPREPMPRAITRVRALLDSEVTVCCAQDDIDNWFYPFGRNDPMEWAQFMAHTGQFAWEGEIDRVLPMITTNPARAIGLPNYGLAVGCQANLVVMDSTDWHAAVQFQPAKRFVILRGRLAAQSIRTEELENGII